jgi:C-terminal processing protease CtpA/Prc
LRASRLAFVAVAAGAALAAAGLGAQLGCGATAPGTIGAVLGQGADRRLFVRGVPAGEGADQAHLEVGDEILAIDGRAVASMSPDDVRRAVRGDVGAPLALTIARGGQRRQVEVRRSPAVGRPAP